jgi:hypothetical protein
MVGSFTHISTIGFQVRDPLRFYLCSCFRGSALDHLVSSLSYHLCSYCSNSVYNDQWCNYPSGQMHEIGKCYERGVLS